MIIPAIDLLNNVVVRLTQGRYHTPSYYDIDASQLARRYATEGAKMLHLVDLSGAKDAQARSTSGLLALTKSTDLAWQVGGGIRSADDIQQLLDHGVSRVVVGSMAIRHPELVVEWLMRFGADKIVLALDVRPTQDGRWLLPVDGWTTETNRELKECLAFYACVGVRHILCTDISRDGTAKGPNVELYRQLCHQYPDIRWQASGGVGSLEHIAQIAATGVAHLIVGKALLDGIFSFKEACICWQNASSPV
ncbi:MAG: 1-(5-phosphoribosyl)-5-[(5-phosphoribosylamino)methylideneamino] imidazole-4-carboxamide isomerase [Gammaproteobacteria bacterium]|nr:MAG: 1-(5-phosphoribosyl)-5-[(5-phosphoribosylamino)methylideneamino] imidazole-4-carboxamide isomerase [Gammaproteobacteria bacterium]